MKLCPFTIIFVLELSLAFEMKTQDEGIHFQRKQLCLNFSSIHNGN